jgi:hypothetical protein
VCAVGLVSTRVDMAGVVAASSLGPLGHLFMLFLEGEVW